MAGTSRERASRLHEVAKALLPIAAEDSATVLSKPKNIYIVLERADRPCNLEHPDIDSFLWIKGNKKISFAKLLEVHRARCPDALDVELTVGGNTMDDQATVGDVPDIKDQLVVVSAVKRESPAPTSSFSNAASSQSSVRQPLQPVNRQLSTPLKRSADELPVKREFKSPGVLSPAQPMLGAAATPQAATTLVSNSTPGVNLAAASPKQEQKDDDEPNMPEAQYEPRYQENPFTKKQEDLEDAEPAMRGVPLSELIKDGTPERLEAGVEAGLRILSKVEAPLKELGDNQDAQNWLAHIAKVREGAKRARTVVGVVGNTGAGKSSVINAMLDEERLVPTNCMRACTAVVTELSLNYSNNPATKYRAEIEFIQPEDWQKELKILFQEIFDEGGGFSKEISNPDSDAAIAYAKVRAVYNTYTREMLANTSIESLMGNKKVSNLLGTSKKIAAREPGSFYKQLQQWVDSKEKGSEKLDKNGNQIARKVRDFEAWPLIKVVKIFCKSPALSTGACIVDLPGVHDSNAARAAVAESYMKCCTGLWIVAPITRAVDDKAAKHLLGESFKRQLKYDGTYSAVTFICSKTDDISRMEAADSLGLNDQLAELDEKANELEKKRRELKKSKETAKGKQKDLDASIEQIEDDIDVWEKLSEDLDSGKTVYAPTKSTKKRKASRSSQQASKRRRRTLDSDDEEDADYDDSASEPEAEQELEAGTPEAPAEPLTEADVDAKLEELHQLKKEARREKRSLGDSLEEIQNLVDSVNVDLADINAKQDAICIAGRNDYSRGAIQQDFAAGVRELDMETAEEEDPDNFDPETDIRDYEKVAESLPVYCVSSRAYQKLSGRLRRDNDVPGFTDIKETEIPALQSHCKKLTEAGRQATCSRFLNNLKQLLTSLQLWAGDDGTGTKLSAAQRDSEKAWLARKLKDLEKALDNTVKETLDDGMETLKEQLFDKFGPAVQSATDEALPKARSWGNRKDEGGLLWATYKATTRRKGVFQGASGARDFNGELTEPMYKMLASAWERCFQRRLPTILRSLRKSASTVLRQFHAEAERRAKERGLGLPRITMLAGQLEAYTAIFQDLCEAAVTLLNDGQKDINREFTPIIMAAMDPAYTMCSDERGKGSFARMKGHMTTHVQGCQDVMFKTASEEVRAKLLQLCKTIRENLLEKTDQVFVSMSRDYMGVNTAEVKLTREERLSRRSVDEAVLSADIDFRDVLERDIEELKAIAALEDTGDVAHDAGGDEDAMDIDNDSGDDNAFDDERDIAGSAADASADTPRTSNPAADVAADVDENHEVHAEQEVSMDGAMAAPTPSADTTEE
ncbi:Nuclear GTPase SLIP-GC [Pseudocercospora fuligena]|uniref:Nuclear GTPase SLIP-GC n=1 Tax=Pseudocercospora fuligena TaxID=685502 RepID=A0A8H6VH72_9PEZI|nr:Nuclear GTPase SLIP-GC [Pseudocercospora fuligena]